VFPRTDPKESQIFSGRRTGAGIRPFVDATRPDVYAGGLTAREVRSMDREFRPSLVFDRHRSAVRRHDHQERVAVTQSFTSLNHLVADLRTADRLAEADRYRVARDGRVSRELRSFSRFASLRRFVGAALVRTGYRLQGDERPADFGALTGHLRIVR
jgi:hypothetical protein